METQTPDELAAKKCAPCEGGVPPYSPQQAQAQADKLAGWKLTHDGKRIRRDWAARDFLAGLEFIAKVAQVAENQGHHPDVHLESYRNVWIEIWTHAIGGLSENDFILAARIDTLPIDTQPD